MRVNVEALVYMGDERAGVIVSDDHARIADSAKIVGRK